MYLTNARPAPSSRLALYNGFILDAVTLLLLIFATTAVAMRLVAPFVSPATDLDFLALAYG
jgi:hypothetical protein